MRQTVAFRCFTKQLTATMPRGSYVHCAQRVGKAGWVLYVEVDMSEPVMVARVFQLVEKGGCLTDEFKHVGTIEMPNGSGASYTTYHVYEIGDERVLDIEPAKEEEVPSHHARILRRPHAIARSV